MDYFDLNMNLTSEDIALKEAASKFAREVMRPISVELDTMSPDEAFAPESPYCSDATSAAIRLPGTYNGIDFYFV